MLLEILQIVMKFGIAVWLIGPRQLRNAEPPDEETVLQ